MLSRFRKDVSGNFLMLTGLMAVPLLGALAIGIDYTEMSRQRHATLNALDAAGIATARRALSPATDEQLIQYGNDFFRANLGPVDPAKATLDIVLPNKNVGGGTLKMSARVKYDPYFLKPFLYLLNGSEVPDMGFFASTEVRLKNTLEVALVLDNSGSMDYVGAGTGKKRIALLKEAAKQLVDTLAAQGALMKQVEEPVRFGLVPFAASVNVGRHHANASWMDTDGRSPIHHENFDWTRMSSSRAITDVGGVYRKTGSGWPAAEKNQIVTRFTLFEALRRRSGGTSSNPTYGPYAKWEGCVETRPHPYAYSNTEAVQGTPATLFVPMFAPDETDQKDSSNRVAFNNWWADLTSDSSAAVRQRHMPKYFEPAPQSTAAVELYAGPNHMCSTTPITPLTDVTKSAGLTKIKNAIDAMQPLGATDVPEGTAWGWRVLSSAEPFTEGRPDHEYGNDKVLIVLTDGENTYYTPNSLGGNDLATNRSIYSNKGYTAKVQPGATKTRLFMGTNISNSSGNHVNATFTSAMNQHMDTVCNAAKDAGIIVMTVALDLSTSNSGERAAIEALSRCASDSRFRKDPSDPSKPAKLFWNAKSSTLADDFKAIADELSNLRIVG